MDGPRHEVERRPAAIRRCDRCCEHGRGRPRRRRAEVPAAHGVAAAGEPIGARCHRPCTSRWLRCEEVLVPVDETAGGAT